MTPRKAGNSRRFFTGTASNQGETPYRVKGTTNTIVSASAAKDRYRETRPEAHRSPAPGAPLPARTLFLALE